MDDWNDYQLFAELARVGSVRTSAARLGTSHSTLSRKISALELRLGVTLFERSTKGFSLTEAGATLLQSIEQAATSIDEGRRAIDGADTRMSGPMRVTMPDLLAYQLLLPVVREFGRSHPEIDIEVDVSYEAFDLARREADVAIRMVHVGQLPPSNLIGRKVATSFATGFASPDYLRSYDLDDPESGAVWLGWEAGGNTSWVHTTSHPHLPVSMSMNNAELQRHAAKASLGIAYIPCIMGDADDGLVRIPNSSPKPARDVWVLTHEDLRQTARMRAFRDVVSNALRSAQPQLEGRSQT
jgi:DNA-binding transcriptional LysR family regulator